MTAPEQPARTPRRWEEDFPISWEQDHYITRRELAKFLTLGSALLAAASALIAIVGRTLFKARREGPRMLVGRLSALPPSGSLLFRYPGEGDPCILVRGRDGVARAYSQTCTHLSCAVVHRPERDGLFCPCHHGWFDERSGRPTAGPPTRQLPRVILEVVGDDVYAVGQEV